MNYVVAALCLVTLGLAAPVLSQEGEVNENISCEEQAKEYGLSEPDDIADYIRDCEEARGKHEKEEEASADAA